MLRVIYKVLFGKNVLVYVDNDKGGELYTRCDERTIRGLFGRLGKMLQKKKS